MEKDNVLYIALVLVVLGVMAGFYLAFDKISTLSTAVSNMALTLEIKNRNETPRLNPSLPISQIFPSSTAISVNPIPFGIIISTAIIFDTQSTPALQPQATTTIVIENVSKNADGSVTVNVKAYTSNASSYTAIDLKGLFALIDNDGNNVLPSSVEGLFQSMPPKSSVTGRIIFTPAANRNTLILQVGSGDTEKFYEFDFVKKAYKETIIG